MGKGIWGVEEVSISVIINGNPLVVTSVDESPVSEGSALASATSVVGGIRVSPVAVCAATVEVSSAETAPVKQKRHQG